MVNRPRCDHCLYWELLNRCKDGGGRIEDADDFVGVCHRFPSQFNSTCADEIGNRGGGQAKDAWWQPLMTGDEWCGEFRFNEGKA